MSTFTTKSGREYTRLPIDNSRGFPQSFPILFDNQTYYFRLYINIAATVLNNTENFLLIPTENTFLVVQVERETNQGNREVVFLRKVVPELEYESENITLTFPGQKVARQNLNGFGEFGSQVIGGIARRWV